VRVAAHATFGTALLYCCDIQHERGSTGALACAGALLCEYRRKLCASLELGRPTADTHTERSTLHVVSADARDAC
jgi:hypothetical protein